MPFISLYFFKCGLFRENGNWIAPNAGWFLTVSRTSKLLIRFQWVIYKKKIVTFYRGYSMEVIYTQFNEDFSTILASKWKVRWSVCVYKEYSHTDSHNIGTTFLILMNLIWKLLNLKSAIEWRWKWTRKKLCQKMASPLISISNDIISFANHWTIEKKLCSQHLNVFNLLYFCAHFPKSRKMQGLVAM